ncbi:MAG: glucosamine-6-phosphate deaminase [Candidatus Limnocylindrales bacterium]
MDVRVVPASELDAAGGTLVTSWLHAAAAAGRSAPTLQPALGTSALGIYRDLARRRVRGELDTAALRLIQLDEYLGLGRTDPRSLLGWLRRDVAEPLAIPDDRIIALPGDPTDQAAALRTYDDRVAAAGGVDIAILGLGPNGHLGFNEPPSDADAPTRAVALTEASLQSNARYWGDRAAVPSHALTAGMTTILGARRILLVVSGRAKQTILDRLLDEPVSSNLPATFLRTVPGVTLLADDEAWSPGRPRPGPATDATDGPRLR